MVVLDTKAGTKAAIHTLLGTIIPTTDKRCMLVSVQASCCRPQAKSNAEHGQSLPGAHLISTPLFMLRLHPLLTQFTPSLLTHHIQDEHQVPAGVTAAHRAEVSVACLV